MHTTMETGFKNLENKVKDVQSGVTRIDRWILLLVWVVSYVTLHSKSHPQSN